MGGKNSVQLPEATVRKYITTKNTKDFINYKAWDKISWSWEQSRQLAPLLRKDFHILFFPLSDSQISLA